MSASQRNFHYHGLWVDGTFACSLGKPDADFHPVADVTDADIESLVRAIRTRVLRFLRRKGKLTDETAFDSPSTAHVLLSSQPVFQHRLPALFTALLVGPALAQDPLTKQAVARIAEVEAQEPRVQAGDRQAALRCINSLDWAGKRLNAVRDKDEANWKDATRRYGVVRAKLEAKAGAVAAPPKAGDYDASKLAQLDKEVAAAFANLQMVPQKLLTDPSRSKSVERELTGFEKRMNEFPAADDAVKAVATRLATFKKTFTTRMGQLATDRGGSDAIGKRLGEVDQKYARENMPRELQPPLSEEQLRGWATDLRNWRDTEITADLAFLDAAAGNAAVDSQHVARLRHWLADSWLRRISEIDGAVRARIESGVLDGQRIADFILETKADDRDQVVNRILGKGRFDDNMARLRDGAHALAMAGVYDQAMAAPVPSDRTAQGDKLTRAIAHLQRLAVTALDAVRMPTAATTDAELLRIAADTLRKPDYGVKGWERLVINSDKVRQEARQAWVQPGAVSGSSGIRVGR